MVDWREQAKAAIEEALGHGYSSLDNFLNALVDAVAPIIRADEQAETLEWCCKDTEPDIRERIARQIEAMRCVQCKGHDDEPQVPALIWRDDAARIARGEQP